MLTNLPDDVTLEYSSTSPECEVPDFCRHLIESCRLLMDLSVVGVFGVEMNGLNKNNNKGCGDWISL